MKKIAILGNMNNNGFSLLRYIHDLGEYADLYLYKTDGIGSLSHFRPESDTHKYEEWVKYIYQTDLNNTIYEAIAPEWLGLLIRYIVNMKQKILRKTTIVSYVRNQKIFDIFNEYDYIVTSGYGPAILNRSGVKCDVFSPHSIGLDGIGRLGYAPPLSRIFQRLIFEIARFNQIAALKNAKLIFISDKGLTTENARKLNLSHKIKDFQMPMVYVEDLDYNSTGDAIIDSIGDEIMKTKYTIMMHSFIAYGYDTIKKSNKISKNNDWLLTGFSEFLKLYPNIDAKLVIVEYGDVTRARSLAEDLELTKHIIWVPKTSRNNILWLLNKVSVGTGEFIEIKNTMWGSTGLEVMAVGKPLLQGFNFDQGEYERAFGHPEPPLLKVRSHTDITNHLIDLVENPQKANSLGRKTREWYEEYNGLNLAKKWLDTIEVQ
jgi:glycosyltransferase involved in cell wall biosynthesis